MRSSALVRLLGLIAVLGVAGCGGGPAFETRVEPFTVNLEVAAEDATPLPEAVLDLVGGGRLTADRRGRIAVTSDRPTAGVVSAPGFLAEPLVVSREQAAGIEVRLWRRIGPKGEARTALHFGGDTMLARRFVEGVDGGQVPLVERGDGGASARAVVAGIAPLFAAADLSTVNLETVIGTLPDEQAYPGKRFLLQSPPEALAALDELGVDVVALGNNHSYDWLEAGLRSTRSALESAGLAFTGAGVDATEARQPAVRRAGGVVIGTLSYTTVDGDFVNDQLPTSGEGGRREGDAWHHQRRPFTLAGGGRVLAGDAWGWFRRLEAAGAPVETAWAVTEAVFPELQDWVARRGHGGAAAFSAPAVAADVAALRGAGADLVVVQIHGGFQFSDVASGVLRAAAHEAVDAGADLVVGHHPHVVQGFEWYRGKLIAHSLGNFVFDQDFLATFPSFFLRTVFEGERMLEARIYPVLATGYRPAPAAGVAASRILAGVAADSDLSAPSARLPDGRVGRVMGSPPAYPVEPAWVSIDGNSGVVERGPTWQPTVLRLGVDGVADLSGATVVRSGSLGQDTEVGVDLVGWGGFDDGTADGSAAGGAIWHVAGAVNAALVAEEPATGDLAARLTAGRMGGAQLRMAARIALPVHRHHDASGVPIDGVPSYSLRMRTRVSGRAEPFVRIDAYRFDDTDPLVDPVSVLVGRTDLRVPVAADGDWHVVTVEIPAAVLSRAEGVNAALLTIGLARGAHSLLEVDDLRLLEWRAAGALPPDTWIAADAVRGSPGADVSVDLAQPTRR